MTPSTLAPPPARRAARWVTLGIATLVVASFATLDLKAGDFLSADARQAMARFAGSFFPPETAPVFLRRVLDGTLETLAMSLLGTLLAALGGLALSLGASARGQDGRPGLATPLMRGAARIALNVLRSVPELVWAVLLLIAAGLGPFSGTLALALHTSGVLGRLFAESIENAPPEPAFALRVRGVGPLRVFLWATLPQIWPQVVSYTLYRWENNIRAAAVLGVVGAGGLGQMLSYHLGLFQMHESCTVLLAMMSLVAVVDAMSYAARRWLNR
ncbi:MAG: phosphonate ABC transporter, permease protein PhnE [Burkholderiales bacterium PBB1]|nr:MAG: phosphonate ABC transporter, permease protein PhnE [Burkholderiales bacterium PBB1]